MLEHSDREWMIPAAAVVAVELLAWIAAYWRGLTYMPQGTVYETTGYACLALVASFYVIRFLWPRRKEEQALSALVARIASEHGRVLSIAVAVQLAAVGLSAFAALKAGIRHAIPF